MYDTNCINCFAQLNGSAVCPCCGFDHGAYVPQPHHLRPGTVLCGRYVIGRAMGQGGFGITYAGFDPNMNRRVAIKEFYPNGVASRDATQTDVVTCTGTGDIAENFRLGVDKCVQEARSLAQLDDIPGVVRGLDQFQANNTAYIIMEFVEGVTLRDYLRRLPQNPDFRQAVELLAPIGTALQEVHARGYVHRDVSPDNIMITKRGEPKLLDFGAVKMVVSDDGEKTEHPVVKRGFSPIEMYSTDGEIGPWSDVYAYCATLYYILVGNSADEPANRIYRDTLGETLANVVSPAQMSVLEKGMALSPQNRYQKMSELLPALAACRADPPPNKQAQVRQKTTEAPPTAGPVKEAPREVSDEMKLVGTPAQETVVIGKTVPEQPVKKPVAEPMSKQREPERPRKPQPETKPTGNPAAKQPERVAASKPEQIRQPAPQPNTPPQATSAAVPETGWRPPVTPALGTACAAGPRQTGVSVGEHANPLPAGNKKKKNVIITTAVTVLVVLCIIEVVVSRPSGKVLTTSSTTQSQTVSAMSSTTQARDEESNTVTIPQHYSANVGDYVKFGSYEQDNNTSNGKEKIEWLVLAKKNGMALLLSKYALDCKTYNETNNSVTWENCTLRMWLNGTFYNEAFSGAEQEQISYTTVTADANPHYDTNPGNNTNDKIFLLSINEANDYFIADYERIGRPTAYAESQGVYVSDNCCWWWLRSPGDDSNIAAHVYVDGHIYDGGYDVAYPYFAVRPALWIILDEAEESTETRDCESDSVAIAPIDSVSVGDYVEFGTYEQDNDLTNGKEKIEWIVLAKENGKALLLSKYALDCKTYNETNNAVTWETCTLRTWLNGAFYNRAFSESEQEQIAYSTVMAEANPDYDTPPGNNTTDKIFLLSINEANAYFDSDEDRKCRVTAYAESQGAYVSENCCWWWLRSPGAYSNIALHVSMDGHVYDGGYGYDVAYTYFAVRPSLWINLYS